MTKIAIVGAYGKAEKRVLVDLLFTPDSQVGIRKYISVNTLLNDINRPNLDLVVLMPSDVKIDLHALKRTLRTPVLHLEIGSRQLNVEINDHIAIVEIMSVEQARDQRVRFAIAASRRLHWQSKDNDWPTALVPTEFLKS